MGVPVGSADAGTPSRRSKRQWEGLDSELWQSDSRPTTATSGGGAAPQHSRPRTPASASDAPPSRPRTAGSACGALESAKAVADAARAAADAALAAAAQCAAWAASDEGLDGLPPAALGEPKPSGAGAEACSGGGGSARGRGAPTGQLNDKLGSTASSLKELGADLAPIPTTLTASSVAEFLNGLSKASTSFEEKLEWTPRIPVVEKPEKLSSEGSSSPSSERPAWAGTRTPLQRVSVKKAPPKEPSPRSERRKPLQRVTLDRKEPGMVEKWHVPHHYATGPANPVRAANPAKPASPAPRGSKHRRHIAAAALDMSSDDGAASSRPQSRGPSDDGSCRGSDGGPEARSNGFGNRNGGLLLPRIEPKGSPDRGDKAAFLQGARRRNDADFRPQAKQGLLMAALHARPPRDSALPPLPAEAGGRSKSAAALHGGRRTEISKMQRSLSLATSPCDRSRGPPLRDDSPGVGAAGGRTLRTL